jgi:hypothetical protein
MTMAAWSLTQKPKLYQKIKQVSLVSDLKKYRMIQVAFTVF